MGKNFVIWGAAGHALVLNDLIQEQGGHILAFADIRKDITTLIDGTPVLHDKDKLASWVSQNPRTPIFAACAIGGARGADRLSYLRWFEQIGLETPALVHSSAIISKSAKYEAGSHILAGAILSAGALIGRGTIINTGSTVDHGCIIGNGVHIAPGATLCGEITIEDIAFIGAGATILPRIRIGRGAIVGAGSVVTKDVPEGITVVGTPARECTKKVK